jgi:hypothetical protein
LTKDTASTNNNERIKIITGQENITNFMLQSYQRAKETLDTCLDFVGPSVLATDYRIMKGVLEIIERGIKIRFITDITKENLNHCKELRKVSEIRHIEGVKGNFGVMDGREYVIHLIQQESQAPSQIIYSNDIGSAQAQQFLFDALWKDAIPLEDRRREIEEGEIPEFVDTIRDPAEARKVCLKIVTAATKEVLILFPTVNGFHRMEREGFMALLQAAAKKGAYIRVLTPMDDRVTELAKRLGHVSQFEVRPIKRQHHHRTVSTIIVSDNAFSLIMGLTDDNKHDFIESTGLSVYSNNTSSIWSHTTIFENLWVHSKLAE